MPKIFFKEIAVTILPVRKIQLHGFVRYFLQTESSPSSSGGYAGGLVMLAGSISETSVMC